MAADPQRAAVGWHSLDARSVAERLATDPAKGLTAAEAARRLAADGPNRFGTDVVTPWWRFALAQFRDVLVLVLVAAAVVSGLVGDRGDTIAIIVIVVMNAVIGTVQEYRADRALAALRRVLAPEAEVLRDGEARSIDSETLVSGDLVRISAGGVVPGDLRLAEAVDLQADESTLTGESMAVTKQAGELLPVDTAVPDRINLLFKGTQITRGRGLGIVVATGEATELGRVAALLKGKGEPATPLQQRLARFSRRLAVAVLLICAVVMWLGWLRGDGLVLAFMTAVSLAVAAIPEALPAVVTVALAIGAARMGKRHALIRRLPAVETLGSVSHICADKTGTLTCNAMTLERWLAAEHVRDGARAVAGESPTPGLTRALALCHDVERSADGELTGDPTEIALVAGAEAAGADLAETLARWPRVGELAFSSERRRMTTIHQEPGSAPFAVTKGAPEAVLPRCRLDDEDREAALAAAEAWAADGYRVLALAERPELDGSLPDEAIEDELLWLGLVGLIDPPRPEAAEAVAECRSAGIQPIMITGDHPGTALAIARRVGIAGPDDRAVTGAELDQASADERDAQIAAARVFARVSPEHKIHIVQALQARGHFVAMSGDGINDAPALKSADIGIAMGLKGTEVAREAADMVLADDNFSTIVRAVREGRRIYDNVRKFVAYTMTSNTGELLTLLIPPLLGLPLPLLPLQILWINLVTDGLPGLAMALEREEPDLMRRAPRPPGESLFAGGLGLRIVWVGALIAAVSVFTQARGMAQGVEAWQTMVFTVLTLAQIFNALALRFERRAALGPGFFGNRWLLAAAALTIALQLTIIYAPWGNAVFSTQPLTAQQLASCVALALLVFVAIELEKLVRRLRRRPAPETAPLP